MSRCHAFNASLLLLVLFAIVALYQDISNLVRSRQVNPPSIDRHLFSSLQVSAFPKSYLNCKLIRSSLAYSNNLSSSLSVSRTKYVSLVACKCFPITSDLMILSHTLHLSLDGTTWIWSIIKTSNLTILSHPLHPSPGRMSTVSIVWIPLIWSSYPILTRFIISRRYVNLVDCLNTRHLIISPHPLQQITVRELGQLLQDV